MIKRLLGVVALGVGLAFVPVTVHSSNDAKMPTLGVLDACAETGACCSSPGDFCLSDGRLIANMKKCVKKPGT
jgi:hypothetical protein